MSPGLFRVYTGLLSSARLHEEGGYKGGDDGQDEVAELLGVGDSKEFHVLRSFFLGNLGI